ncbi:15533_t:CDS:2 [Cetraspora pellucida]|uniref:15533_t:CDS:1 n=1 Tax=Cetraspora pellucida TaxID=1433469 RepID=A0A9N9EP17_9GLOM|nr:15533_t:CDS:2 [Cetraspora pellucida]
MIVHDHDHRQNRKMPRQFNNEDLENIDKIEDLPSVSTTSLLNRLSHLLIQGSNILIKQQELKISFTVLDDIEKSLADRSYNNDDDFF